MKLVAVTSHVEPLEPLTVQARMVLVTLAAAADDDHRHALITLEEVAVGVHADTVTAAAILIVLQRRGLILALDALTDLLEVKIFPEPGDERRSFWVREGRAVPGADRFSGLPAEAGGTP